MVEFHLLAALVAGLAATVVMTVMMNAAKAAGMTNMPPMPLVMGSMMSGNRRTATGIGAMLHFVVMGTVIFGLSYAVLFSVFDNDAWWLGMFIGLVHGLVVGAVAMPTMPSVHPRMERQGTSMSGGSTVTEQAGEVRLAAPGMLASVGTDDTGWHLDGPCPLRGDPGTGLWMDRRRIRRCLGRFGRDGDSTGFPPT